MIRYTARDEINQSSIGPTPSGWLQEVDYTYLDNGFLRDINDPITPGPDLFSLRLYYSFPLHGQDPTPQDNGNIAAQQIHLGGSDGVCYTQNFHYDELDRLTRSTYFAHGAPDAHNRYDTDYGYDRRGNLTQLNRHGRYAVDDDNYGFGQIDQLDYAYLPGTNKIKSIADRVAEGAGAGAGFAPHDRGDYRYDDPTGNLTYDPSRDLTIQYNHLNLPHTFTRGNGSGVSYLYTADGAKLRETTRGQDGTLLHKRDYLGPVILEDGVMQSIQHADGRVVPGGGCVEQLHVGGAVAGAETYRATNLTADATVLPTGRLNLRAGRDVHLQPGFVVEPGGYLKTEKTPCYGPVGEWRFEYFLTDHKACLGGGAPKLSNRVLFADVDGNGSIDAEAEVLQENHYYAFGLGMEGAWSEREPETSQRYRYNGKELNEDLGLYDYGLRNYDPAIGRWLQIDPKAEKYTSHSGYNYVLNNPIRNTDPNGDTVRIYTETINSTYHTARHTYIRVTTEDRDVIVEVYGPDSDQAARETAVPQVNEVRWQQIDPRAEKYAGMSPYNGMGNNPITYSDPMGDTLVVRGTDEFREQAKSDIRTISQSSEAGAKLIKSLMSASVRVTISENEPGVLATLIYGSEEASVRSSNTIETEDGGDVEVEYGQVYGVEVDGVNVSSDDVLHHELVHARDFITNEVTIEEPELLRKPGEQKGRLEARAVMETNDYRRAKNPVAPLRTHYQGTRVVTSRNKIIKGVKIY